MALTFQYFLPTISQTFQNFNFWKYVTIKVRKGLNNVNYNNWNQPQYGYNQFQRQNDNSIPCILVPSSAQFDNVTIGANQKIIVMSQSEPLFAFKTADSMGFVNTRYCNFNEYDPKETAQQQQASIEQRLSRLEELVNGKSVNGYDGKYEQPVEQSQ